MEKQQLVQLEAQIKEVKTTFADLSDGTDLDELLRIIHRPGYTTPAEHSFVQAIVETLGVQAKTLIVLKQALLAGARTVGTKSATA